MRQYKTVQKQRAKDQDILHTSLMDRFKALQPAGSIDAFADDQTWELSPRVAALEQQEGQKIIAAYQKGAPDKRALSEALAHLLELAALPLHRYFNAPDATGMRMGAYPASEARTQAGDILKAGLRTIRNAPPIVMDTPPAHKPRRLWLVSPMEGIDHDDTAMSITLIDNGIPTAGIIHFPKKGRTYAGVPGEFAFMRIQGGKSTNIRVKNHEFFGHVAGTAHHARRSLAFRTFTETHSVKRIFGEAAAPYGLCRMAQGSLDLYLQPAMLPQGALSAAHAVLAGAGGIVRTFDGAPMAFTADRAGAPALPFVAAASEKSIHTHETRRLVV